LHLPPPPREELKCLCPIILGRLQCVE